MTLSVTLVIIIVTVAVSFIANRNDELYSKMLFSPYMVAQRKEWYRLITHGFIHSRSNIFHLIFNMLVLYVMSMVEDVYTGAWPKAGIAFYLGLYLGGMVFASLPSLQKHKDNYGYAAVGASGAVAAVMFGAVVAYPDMTIRMMLLPIPMPMIVFAIFYLVVEWWLGKRGGTGIAHDAHFYGALFGFLYTLVVIPGSFQNFITRVVGIFT